MDSKAGAKSRWNRLLAPSAFKIGLLATIACAMFYGVGSTFFHMMELKAYDLHYISRGMVKPGGEVVIAAIDEKSINKLGRWPWSRSVIAALVDKLNTCGAKAVAFDVIFSEPDESSGLSAIRDLKKRMSDKGSALQEIEEAERKADNDSNFAAVLKNSPSVILGYFFFTGDDSSAVKGKNEKKADYMAPSRYSSIRFLDKGVPQPKLLEAANIEENIKTISDAGSTFAYFNVIPDPDGTVRRVPLVIKYGEELYPSLSLQAVRKYLDNPPIILNAAEYGVDSIQVGKINIPTDEKGRLLVNFRGPEKTFPHHSIADILSGEVSATALKDKIVLVGATAIGIYDMRVVPFSGTFAGIEVHANVIDTILRRDFISRPEWITAVDLLAIILLGILLSIMIPRMRAGYSILAAAGFIVLYILLNNFVFNSWKVWLSEVYPVFTIVFVSVCVTTYQFMTEERKKKEIKEAFSRYVAPSLVGEILKDPKKLVLGGEERRLTVLFSDIRGFTSISENLQPQVLVKLMNDYLTPMTEVVLKDRGTVDKYMGDAIMAFWGAPIWQEDHAARACRTSLDMLKRLAELQTGWEKKGLPKIDIGIGLSTGKVTVGNMGSTTRFDYTVMGDTVNLGSRLEGLNKEYGTHIIVPKNTYDDVKGEFILRPLDLIKVKGKDIPVRIYELMGYRTDKGNLLEVAQIFEAALDSYMKRDWDKAEGYFGNVLKLSPEDGPSKVFVARVKQLRQTPLPPEWDGVFVMTKK